MSFLSLGEPVEKPCSDVLSHPLQCFQELFLATPAIVGTFFVGIGGFFVALLIWGAIFASAIYATIYLLKHLFKATRYFFTETRVGQKVSSLVPIGKYLQKFSCKAQEVQPKRLINAQAIGDYGANIVSKVHVDSKWFKSALKHVPFTKSNELGHANPRSPTKTPSKSNSPRLSGLTAKILSPKSIKQH